MMSSGALQPMVTWAEDRATQRCDSSADPGVKSEERAVGQYPAVRPSCPLRIWHQSDKPSRHDAATFLAGCPSSLANAYRLKFQFTVNQNTVCDDQAPFFLFPNSVLSRSSDWNRSSPITAQNHTPKFYSRVVCTVP